MTIYVNEKEVESFNFSGGECHVRIDPSDVSDNTKIVAELHNSDLVMQLLMVVDAVRRVNPNSKIDLTIPYFPYARQDRVCNEGEAFSVKVMAGLINQLRCESVTIYDPHSKVTIDSINNCQVVTMADIISASPLADKIKQENITLIAPDKGAKAKVRQVSVKIGIDYISANKVRDVETREIIKTELMGDVSGKDFIVLDDICDGGRTFTNLAKLLKSKGAGKIYLYITHGIFSQGLAILKESFEHIYCYQTFLKGDELDQEFLTILDDKMQCK